MSHTKTRRHAYIERLVEEYRYPIESVRTEVPFSQGMARYVLDVVVYLRGRPYIVAEVTKDTKDERILEQARRYSTIGNRFAVITDGYNDYCFQVLQDPVGTRFIEIPDIPKFEGSLIDIGKQKYSELVAVDNQRFRVLVHNLFDMLREKIGSPLEVLRLLSFFLLAKIYDEDAESGLFRASYEESNEIIKAKLLDLFRQVSTHYPYLECDLNIDAETLSMMVRMTQKFKFRSNTREGYPLNLLLDEEVLRRLYGEYYTPRAIGRLMIDLLRPAKGKTLVDPACGLGGLLLEAAAKGCKVTGFDIIPTVAQIAQINLLLSSLPGKVHLKDSLQRLEMERCFDYVAVVPPFSGTVRDHRLRYFELGGSKTSQRYSILFLELALRLVKPKGRIAILVPDGVLSSSSCGDARRFIYRRSNVKAVVKLPSSSFKPYSGVKTTLLILEREDDWKLTEEDEVFIARLKDLQKSHEIIAKFLKFEESHEIQESESVFAVKIQTPRQLDVTHLRGLCSLRFLDAIETVKLGQLADINTGISIDRIGLESADGDSFYLRAGNILDLSINTRSAKLIKVMRDASRWRTSSGDVLLTRAGTVGRVAIVQDDAPSYIIGVNLVRIRIREPSQILPKYLLAYLMSDQGKEQISMFAGGSAIKSINVNGLRNLRIPLIPLERQQEIANELDEIIRAKKEAERMLTESEDKQREFFGNLDNRIMAIKERNVKNDDQHKFDKRN